MMSLTEEAVWWSRNTGLTGFLSRVMYLNADCLWKANPRCWFGRLPRIQMQNFASTKLLVPKPCPVSRLPGAWLIYSLPIILHQLSSYYTLPIGENDTFSRHRTSWFLPVCDSDNCYFTAPEEKIMIFEAPKNNSSALHICHISQKVAYSKTYFPGWVFWEVQGGR